MNDKDFIWMNDCTFCVQECQLTGPAKHELCNFIGKCRSCDNYIHPYQSPGKYVERDLSADQSVDKLTGPIKNNFQPGGQT